jgi:hypothetical protein
MRSIVCVLAAASAMCMGADSETTLHPAHTFSRPGGEWRDSADGKVSICLAPVKTTFGPDEEVVVRCFVRNNTDAALTLIKPFGDDFFAICSGLVIVGPDGAVEYRGPMKDYVLGTRDFIQLPGKSAVDQTLTLPRHQFPNLAERGLYTIAYLYLAARYPRDSVPEDLWQGQVQSATITLLVR